MAPAVLLAVALTACASDSALDAGVEEGSDGMAEDVAGGGAPASDGGRDLARAPAGAGDAAQPLSVGLPLGRQVIRTAEIGLELRDTDTALDRISALVDRVGGFIASAELFNDADGRPEGTIVVRIPTRRLETTLAALEDLAENVSHRQLGSQDVTEEYADIDARLRNLEALETELVGLLAEVRASSSKASEILQVFERVREVRTEIERLRGRQQLLDDLVDLATVTVTVTPTVAVPGVLPDDGWRPATTAREALATTLAALAAIGNGVIWVGLTILPVVALVGLPFGFAWGLWRRRRGSQPAAS